jgi:hypothetical protein
MTGYSTAVLTAARIENEVFSINANDPNGMFFGWKSLAPQGECGYSNEFDAIANDMLGFNIHATRFVIGENVVLRLWKGYYGGVIGGEIGIYGKPIPKTNKETGKMIQNAIKQTGLILAVEVGDINQEMTEKVINSIERAGSLFGIKAGGIDQKVKEITEEFRRNILYSIFKSDKLRDNNNVPLLGQKNVIENIMKVLITPENIIKKIPQLRPFVELATLNRIITVYQKVNFVAELIKILVKTNDGDGKFSSSWGHSLSGGELDGHLGLTGTAVQVFYKKNGKLVTERQEQDAKFWTTAFAKGNGSADKVLDFTKIVEIKDKIYTVNHFYFKDKEYADYFYNEINKTENMSKALDYKENKSEKFKLEKPNNTTVIIVYGKET